MSQGKALYELQQMDLELAQHKTRLDEIEALLANNEAVQAAQQRVDRAEQHLKPLQTKMRDLDLQIKSTRDKRQQTEDRLYSGAVTNPKEMQDMQQEITSLQKRSGDLEDQMLELMLQIDDAEDTLDAASANLEDTVNANASENAELLEERKLRKRQVEALEVRRENKAASISSDNLRLYDQLRQRTANRPISTLTGEETCSLCGVRQNTSAAKAIRRGDQLIKCSNCQRILISL